MFTVLLFVQVFTTAPVEFSNLPDHVFRGGFRLGNKSISWSFKPRKKQMSENNIICVVVLELFDVFVVYSSTGAQ